MKPFLERLSKGEVLISDGATGTMLQQLGGYSKCPEELNLTRPEVLEEIARLYLEAGAQIIATNTFGATPLKLDAAGLGSELEEVNRVAVEAVRRSVGEKAYVAGDCGPTGKLLLTGETSPEELEEGYRRQTEILADAGVDVFFIETMTDAIEAMIAVRAAKSSAPGIPIVATMTFDPSPHGFRTIMGVSIEDATTRLLDVGADVVGSNCGHGLEVMVEIARDFRQTCAAPLIIQSNAGLPVLEGEKVVYPETPEFFAGKVPELLEAGVAIIGGCCGTTPEHIGAIKAAVDTLTG